MSVMLEEKRKTRGNRMTDLIGEAAEEDATFWGDAVWAEDSEDDSFGSEDEVVKPDEFDSDFDESEGSEEEGSDNEENARKAVRRASSSNKYKEPPAERKRKALPDHENAGEAVSSPRLKKPKAERRPSDQSLEGMNFERTVRESTKTKSEVAHISRLASQSSDKSRPVYVKPKIHHFTQKELLLDALETEKINEKWLRLQKLAEDEKAASDRPVKAAPSHYVRFISKRGAYNTITFSDVDLMPRILKSNNDNITYDDSVDGDDDF